MNLDYLNKLTNLAINEHAFPGGVLVSGSSKNPLEITFNFGHHTYDKNSPLVAIDHYFDLASLTKVVATTPSIMQLISQNELLLNDKISKFLSPSWFLDNQLKQDIEIIDLLAHCSGFAPCVDAKLILDSNLDLDARWSIIKQMPLAYVKRSKTVYSDIGFIILGRIIEIISKVRLDEFAKEHIFNPLGMKGTTYNPSYLISETIPTEFTVDGKLLQGVVHDECCRAIGGISGHAGLFSSVIDLAKYAQTWLNSDLSSNLGWGTSDLMDQFKQKANLAPFSTRALGWNTVSIENYNYTINEQYSAGNYIEDSGFGHTGFVGNSIWISPRYDRFVILLTNQVYPKRSEVSLEIKQYWRNKLTNAIWEILGYTKLNNLPILNKRK